MPTTILKNWKSSLIGIVAGGLYIVAQTYKPGMTWRDWGAGIGMAILGLVVKDSTTHSTLAEVNESTPRVP